ncbi:MAG: 3-isopropylmalate dehydrogenase [Vampirovibrionales bacterium]|nr:3-isopropylmalate dehydrogenase [Vampirovibrionales bacterium]
MTSLQKTIAILAGDGIGPEIMAQALKVLNAIETVFGYQFTYEYGAIGGAGIDESGVPLPEKTLKLAQSADAVLLGAVGGPQYDTLEPSIRPEQGLLQIRKALGLYANLRPVKAYEALLHASTLKPEVLRGVDMLVVRELTGGLYFGEPKWRTDDEAVDTMRYTRAEIERIAHVAFKAAQQRRGKVISVDKANVLKTSQLWRDVVEGVAKCYPTVELSHLYVDNAAMQLILNPQPMDVVLTENMFGDILSDEASMLTGSLGMLPSASLNASLDGSIGLYEPSHGSAPTLAGKDIANPIAQILSVAMMLTYSFNALEAAKAIEDAVDTVLSQGLRTADIAEADSPVVGTTAMGDAIAASVLSNAKVTA